MMLYGSIFKMAGVIFGMKVNHFILGRLIQDLKAETVSSRSMVRGNMELTSARIEMISQD